jgi:hypothetical protein
MTWIIQDENEERFPQELHTHSDRVAGLLEQSLVERRLLAAIKARWQGTDAFFKDLFEGTAPSRRSLQRLRSDSRFDYTAMKRIET